MLEGLVVLLLKCQVYCGWYISEFDFDVVFVCCLVLILMDELVYSNVSGFCYFKCWQDIEELLEVGIDVFIIVNVQYLESLNDVVSGVIGIQVWEIVFDFFFDVVDDVVLVDLFLDDLCQWLKEGKVYIVGQVECVIEYFFCKGNLIVLCELVLCCIVDCVDE